MPDFAGASRQRSRDHEWRFKEHDGDLKGDLTRKRNVDEKVVEALTEALTQEPLGKNTDRADRVNERLLREDLTDANIQAG